MNIKKDPNKIIIQVFFVEQADVIMNIIGNIVSGQVTGDTAKQLSERFGKIMQDRESLSINRGDTSISREYNYIPSGMIPCCRNFTFGRTTAEKDSSILIQKANNTFNIYPNPAQNGQILKIDYSFAKNESLTILSVFNMMGQKVVSRQHY